MNRERDIHTSSFTGVRIDRLLADVLLTELLTPSAELWLVSPWISDIEVLDNTGGTFDAVFDDPMHRTYDFSEILGLLTRIGSIVRVVTRPNNSHQFLNHLRSKADPAQLIVSRNDENLHTKVFCGHDWLIKGSMNYTQSGMTINDELSEYVVNETKASKLRVEFDYRFGGGPWE